MKRIFALAAAAALLVPAPARGAFAPAPGSPVAIGASTLPYGIEAANLGGDASLDLVTANSGTNTATVLLRQPGGTFSPQTAIPSASGTRAVAPADFNGDTRTDLAVLGSSGLSILLGQAGGGFAPEATPPTFAGSATDLRSADFNGDTKPDLAVATNAGIYVFLRGTGGFLQEGGAIAFPLDKPARVLATADFNGDARVDIATTQPDNDAVYVLLRQSGGGFLADVGAPFPAGDNPTALAAADWNLDTRPDLSAAAANGTRPVTTLLRQNPSGFATEANPPLAPDYPTDAAAGDFNGDGRPDLAFTTSGFGGKVTVLLRQSGGGWAPDPGSPITVPDGPQSLTVGDFGGSTRPDIAVASSNGGTVSVLLNTGGPLAPDTAITAGPGAATNDTTPSFSFASTPAGATFSCRVDSAAFAACTSPHTTGALAPGSHTFEVRATNGNGTDPTPASRTFTVDTAAPDTTITAGPSGATADHTPTFSFSSNDTTATFTCTVDSNPSGPCASPFTTPALGAGPHTFSVRARDSAGNVDATPATRSFDVAPSPPVARLSVTPNPTCVGADTIFDGSASSSEGGPIVNYRFEYDEVVSYKTQLDGSKKPVYSTIVVGDGPAARKAHTFSWNTNSNALKPFPDPFNSYMIRLDADVKLTVTDADGRQASTVRRVGFIQGTSRASSAGCPPVVAKVFYPATNPQRSVATSTAVSTSLGCVGALRCLGSVSFSTTCRACAAAARVRRVVIAKGGFSIPARKRRTVKARLTKVGRRVLRGRRQIRVRVTTTTFSPRGRKIVRNKTVTMKVRRPKG